KGAPNVLVILLDDVGFGHTGTFGGPVPTPTLDRLARNGLKYNAFHTTALCSPTRAALLTGRNHHSAGAGGVTGPGHAVPGVTRDHARRAGLVGRSSGGQTAPPPPCSARRTPRRRWRSARPVPSTAGPPARGSTTSTASTRARRASGTRCSTATPRRS